MIRRLSDLQSYGVVRAWGCQQAGIGWWRPGCPAEHVGLVPGTHGATIRPSVGGTCTDVTL